MRTLTIQLSPADHRPYALIRQQLQQIIMQLSAVDDVDISTPQSTAWTQASSLEFMPPLITPSRTNAVKKDPSIFVFPLTR
jgi:hypothetical protein